LLSLVVDGVEDVVESVVEDAVVDEEEDAVVDEEKDLPAATGDLAFNGESPRSARRALPLRNTKLVRACSVLIGPTSKSNSGFDMIPICVVLKVDGREWEWEWDGFDHYGDQIIPSSYSS